MNVAFDIDGVRVGNFQHMPDPNSQVLFYDSPIYSNSSLRDGDHTMVISPTAIFSAKPNAGHSLILFDYAVYT
jgi:hypothetical protein